MNKEKLKTLKDLEFNGTYDFYDILRNEAIKRVKICCPEALPDQFTKNKSRCDACERDIWFFNITEEDLKQEGGE